MLRTIHVRWDSSVDHRDPGEIYLFPLLTLGQRWYYSILALTSFTRHRSDRLLAGGPKVGLAPLTLGEAIR